MPALKTQGTELFYMSSNTVMTKVGAITGVSGLSGGASKIDTTDLDSTERTSIAGLPDPGALTVPINFDPSNATHIALAALFAAGTVVTWVVGLSDGTAPPTVSGGTITYPTTRTFINFNGYISDFPLEAPVNDKVQSQMSVQRSGPKTIRAKT